MRLNVTIQRNIIQTHVASPRLSNRKIADNLDISHKTVSRVLKLYQNCGYSYAELSGKGDYEFQKLLGSLLKKPRSSLKTEPDWSYIDDELKKRDMTLKLLWQEYRFENQNCYSESQFYRKFATWKKTQRISLRKIHKMGEQIEVDFAGRKMTIIDPKTGTEKKVKVFVGVLCCSQYIFAIAVDSEKTEDFQKCINEMLTFFDGVPQQIVSDNLKAAVIKNTKNALVFNQRFAEQAHYYNFAIMPTRPRKPSDKGLVEVCVRIVQQGVLAPLRNTTFHSLEELNTEIAKGMHRLNNKRTKRFKTSRYDRYLKFDKPHLAKLPEAPYKIKTQLPSQKVNRFYEIQVNGVTYQVPYQLSNQMVDIYRVDKFLEIYHQNIKVATLVIAQSGCNTVINYDFMPENHRTQHESTKSYLLSWMSKQGDDAAIWFEEFISDNSKLKMNLKKFTVFKDWVINEGLTDRVDAACDFAIMMDTFTITNLKSLITSQSYLRHKKPSSKKVDVKHENIRGSDYYKHLISKKESVNA